MVLAVSEFRPGLYVGAHPGCSVLEAHRHPLYDRTNGIGSRTPQPVTVTATVPATVTYEVIVDVDGAMILRGASFRVREDELAAVEEPYGLSRLLREASRESESTDGMWERVLQTALEAREGECAVGESR
jgi:hypothetical protein